MRFGTSKLMETSEILDCKLKWVKTVGDLGMGVNVVCMWDLCESLGAKGWIVEG